MDLAKLAVSPSYALQVLGAVHGGLLDSARRERRGVIGGSELSVEREDLASPRPLCHSLPR